MIRLWIDDVRPVPLGFNVWAKDAEAALEIFKTGKVTFASFDHDLAEDSDGTFEKDGSWLVNQLEHLRFHNTIPSFRYFVHSANPRGADYMASVLNRITDEEWLAEFRARVERGSKQAYKESEKIVEAIKQKETG